MNPFHSFLDERERWFLWLPALMAAGIAAYFALPFEPSLHWLIAAPALAVCALLARNTLVLQPLTVALLALALGFNAAQVETALITKPLLTHPLAPTSITGTLIRAEAMPEGSRLTLSHPSIKNLPKEERPALVRVKVRTPFAALPEAGARVNLWGPLWPPADPALPHGYDFRRTAFFKQIGAVGLSYVELREREPLYPTPFFWDGFHILFEKARRALTLLALGQEGDAAVNAMTAALLSGSQTPIDKSTMEAMRASGLSHLLSISGVHVSMIALLFYAPFRFVLALWPWLALRLPIKKIAAAFAIIMTSLYTLMVGADAPTIRSALMTGLVMFAILMDRKAMSLRLVAFAALAIMLLDPSAVMGASFQMSFAAVLAMVAFYEKRLDETLGLSFDPVTPFALENQTAPPPHPLSRLMRGVKDIVITSLIATAATTPFTLFHFQTFNFYGVIANILAIPITTLWVMPFLLIATLTAPLGWAGWALQAAGWGIGFIIEIATTVAAWPYAQILLPSFPNWALLSFLVGGLWLCLWQRRWRWLGLAPIAAVFLYPLTVSTPDLFIDADKPVWAARLSDGRLAVYGKREESFTTAQWQQQSGLRDVFYFRQDATPPTMQELFCDEGRCLFEKEGTSVMVLMPQAEPVCPKTTITVAFLPLPPCLGTILIDQAALTARGAHTITLRGTLPPLIETTFPTRKSRPWSQDLFQKKTAPEAGEGKGEKNRLNQSAYQVL